MEIAGSATCVMRGSSCDGAARRRGRGVQCPSRYSVAPRPAARPEPQNCGRVSGSGPRRTVSPARAARTRRASATSAAAPRRRSPQPTTIPSAISPPAGNGPSDRGIAPGHRDGGSDDRPRADGDEQQAPPARARLSRRRRRGQEHDEDQRRDPLVELRRVRRKRGRPASPRARDRGRPSTSRRRAASPGRSRRGPSSACRRPAPRAAAMPARAPSGRRAPRAALPT